MLYGEPGTGKTSVIKAIAHDTKRHIVNIRLSSSTTQTQLKNLFFNERITVLTDGKNEVYNIPLDERIYVIEDIDCISNVVYSRNEPVVEPIGTNEIVGKDNLDEVIPGDITAANQFISDIKFGKEIKPFKQEVKPEMNETLTLSFLLNLFDGILETPNRILIITTNYPEKLDEALVRAGRIDVKIHVGCCDYDMIKDIYNFFYKTNREFDITYNKPITPAELNKICIDNFNNPELAYDTIRQTVE
jgi:mitochondrial chaperone BCS1